MLTFVTLIVGTLGDLSAPARGAAIDICCIDGGCSRISVSILPGARHRRFLALMVGAPGSSALAPPSCPAINVCYADGGHF
jgi:hypothetical protein